MNLETPRFVRDWLAAWEHTPAESKNRRLILSALLGVSFCVTAVPSLIFSSIGPIPFKILPDVRLPALFLLGFGGGLYASWGSGARRVHLLWTTLLISFAFHLEEATVHWFDVGLDGSITGTRAGIPGTLASLGGIACVLLLHAEVEAWRFARDVTRRGAPAEEAADAAGALAGAARRRVLPLAGAVAGLVVVVRAAELLLGGVDLGGAGPLALGLGGALLVAAGVLAWMAAQQSVAEREKPGPESPPQAERP